MEADIGGRYGVTQQAVSEAILKHVRDLPAREAESLRRTQLESLDSMSEMALNAYARANSGEAQLEALNTLLGVEERKAKLLGLDAADRKVAALERPTARSILVDPASSEVASQILKDLQAADSTE